MAEAVVVAAIAVAAVLVAAVQAAAVVADIDLWTYPLSPRT